MGRLTNKNQNLPGPLGTILSDEREGKYYVSDGVKWHETTKSMLEFYRKQFTKWYAKPPVETETPQENSSSVPSVPSVLPIKASRWLKQKDFEKGSVTITEPGVYTLAEDIVFSFIPEPETPGSFTRQLHCYQEAFKILRKPRRSRYFANRSISDKPEENEGSMESHLIIHEWKENPAEDLLSQSKLPSRQSQYRFKRKSAYLALVKIQTSTDGTPRLTAAGKLQHTEVWGERYALTDQGAETGYAKRERNASFCRINPLYIGGATIRNGTAAIKIACHNVTIDLNRHSIQQSKQNYIEQRVFSCIEINRLQFSNSGRDFEPGPNVEQPGISNTTIRNGKLGRTSHFGIHGTNPNLVICEDLEITNFDVAGIWLNNANQPIIRNCVINGPITHAQPVAELRAFKTVGTGVSSIVDSNVWDIFLNDAGGQVQRMFAPDSDRILETRPPFDGVEGARRANRMLVGPRGGAIEGCKLGQIISRQIQAHVVARTDKSGIVVPVLFSIAQQAHSGMTACPRMIRAAMEDGADYRNEFNPKYMELKDWVRIKSSVSYRLDAGGNQTSEPGPNLQDVVLLKSLRVFREAPGKAYLLGGQQEICVDKFEIDRGGNLIISALAYVAGTPEAERVTNVIVPAEDISCHHAETVEETFTALGTGAEPVHTVKGTYLAPRWKLLFDDRNASHLFESPDGTVHASTCVVNAHKCAVFHSLNRRIPEDQIIHPRKVEHKYKLASRCIEKDLEKHKDGRYPALYFPNANECDLEDQIANTGFRHFYENDDHLEHLHFVHVIDNFGLNDVTFYQGPSGNNPDRHGVGRPPIHDYSGGSTQANTDGVPYKSHVGDYFNIRQGRCHHPNSRFHKLSAKLATTLPLVNEMLNGRCEEEECGGVRTEGSNAIDAGGHNLIGAFGILMERAWGVSVVDTHINGVMVVRGADEWAENWWGLMANNSAFNLFQNLRITNLPGNPGTVFGFHLSHGSFSNVVEALVLEGCTSTGEAYGVSVDRGSENNVFTNCRVSGVIAREFAAAYLLRGSFNELIDCTADNVILELENGAETGGDLIAAGFLLGIEDEHFSAHPRGNKLVRCSAHGVRVIHANETTEQREKGTWAPLPDPRPDENERKTFLSGILSDYPKFNDNVVTHTRDLLTDVRSGELVSKANAYWPNLSLLTKGWTRKLPNSLPAFSTLAPGLI